MFRLRLTFLAKFTLVTFALAVGTAAALAFTLVRVHTLAVEQDEAVNATGEILATLSPGLERLAGEHPGSRAPVNDLLRNGVAAGLRHQFIYGIRIYAPDGTPIYPADNRLDPDGVAHALHTEDFWSRYGRTVDGLPVRVQYVPYAAGGRVIAVVAIELSLDQMHSQVAGEQRIVILATIGAVSIIFLALVAEAAGSSRELERKRRQAEETFTGTLGAIAEMLELHDSYAAGHSRRVAEYSRELGRALGLAKRQIEIISHAAMLHDIGKIGIADSILYKNRALDESDRTTVSKHPVLGAQIIGGISSMEDVAPSIMHHHERVDGTGYPARLVGEAIPLGSRLIAVADAFDSMTTDRPYRRAMPVEAALTELQRAAGTQFDLKFVNVFVELARTGKVVPPPAAPHDVEPEFPNPKVTPLKGVV